MPLTTDCWGFRFSFHSPIVFPPNQLPCKPLLEPASGEMSPEEFISFLTQGLDLLRAQSEEGSVHFVFTDWRHSKELFAAGEQVIRRFAQPACLGQGQRRYGLLLQIPSRARLRLSLKTLCSRFGISDVALKKTSARSEIPTPERGYWAKKDAGKPPSRQGSLFVLPEWMMRSSSPQAKAIGTKEENGMR
jgi:hypothetical protein